MNNKLRKEEYTVAGNFLKTSFANDRADLATRFPEFTPEYQTAFEASIDLVEDLEQGVVLTEEQKTATAVLYSLSKELNSELNFLTFYFKRAGLDSKMVSNLKKDLTKNNIEGCTQKITGLLQFIADKRTVLTEKGMAGTFESELAQTRDNLNEKNELQNQKMNALKDLHSENKAIYKELYQYISIIADAGKIKYKNTIKADQYTISKIIARMRTSNQ